MLFRSKSQIKIFCIGANKTGTTSLENALSDFGYKMGNQQEAELLLNDYKLANWKPIIKFCDSAQAFQDIPFSCPYTWLILHHYFPEAKFILTVRDDSNMWYNSLVRFHSKLFADKIRIPTKEDLKNASYCYKGFVYDSMKIMWKTPDDDLYNEKILKKVYETHNDSVRHFFKNNPNFLEINLSDESSYLKLCEFLKQKPLYNNFPHLNIT